MRGMLFGLFWLALLVVGRCGRQEADKECERTIQEEVSGCCGLDLLAVRANSKTQPRRLACRLDVWIVR
jgi:hypothetical protein